MTTELSVLCGTAVTVGFVHTFLGPDHYIPFVAMSRAGRWSQSKTLAVTLICGLAHVLSSVLLGVIGIAAGIAVLRLESIESHRGDLAGWLFIGFGAAYSVWGLRRALRSRPHAHIHAHADGTVHAHAHTHDTEHLHVHAAQPSRRTSPKGPASATTLSPWMLFTIFGFGPCEPLIPILMYPAATGSLWNLVIVTVVFAVATLTTMTVMVIIGQRAIAAVPLGRLERYSHALAGLALVLCGAAIQSGL